MHPVLKQRREDAGNERAYLTGANVTWPWSPLDLALEPDYSRIPSHTSCHCEDLRRADPLREAISPVARHTPQSSSHSASPVSFSCVCLAFQGPLSGKCLPQSPQETHLSFSRIWEQRTVLKKPLSLLANPSHVLTFAFL